jgi:hypothetical protein
LGAVNLTESFQVMKIVRKNSGKKIAKLINGDVILSMRTPAQDTPTIPSVAVTRKVTSRFICASS